MSQRVFRYKNCDVICGWDRPLQHYFLLIEDVVKTSENIEVAYIYNNLDDPSNFNGGMSLDKVLDTLANLGIPVPEALVSDLSRDGQHNAGNINENYGTVPEPPEFKSNVVTVDTAIGKVLLQYTEGAITYGEFMTWILANVPQPLVNTDSPLYNCREIITSAVALMQVYEKP